MTLRIRNVAEIAFELRCDCRYVTHFPVGRTIGGKETGARPPQIKSGDVLVSTPHSMKPRAMVGSECVQ